MLALYLSMLETEEEKLTFTEIYEQLKLPCLHVALKITKNQAMAEDAIHNAFITLIKQKDELFALPCGKRKSRIVIIVKNKAIDLLRYENRRTSEPIDELEDDAIADSFDISASAESKEAHEYLLDCIAGLPEIYKVIFELRYVHDMSNPEIAEQLGIEPKTVSMRISRAKGLLSKMLQKEGVISN